MKLPKLPISLPTGSPATEALKLASFLVATLLVSKLLSGCLTLDESTDKQPVSPYCIKNDNAVFHV